MVLNSWLARRILVACEVRSVRLIPDEWDEFGKSGLLGEVQLLTSGLYEAVWVLRNELFSPSEPSATYALTGSRPRPLQRSDPVWLLSTYPPVCHQQALHGCLMGFSYVWWSSGMVMRKLGELVQLDTFGSARLILCCCWISICKAVWLDGRRSLPDVSLAAHWHIWTKA